MRSQFFPDPIVPTGFYISPSEAAHMLKLLVREIHLLRVKGKLKDVVATPGNHRRYTMREVLGLQDEVKGDTENGQELNRIEGQPGPRSLL